MIVLPIAGPVSRGSSDPMSHFRLGGGKDPGANPPEPTRGSRHRSEVTGPTAFFAAVYWKSENFQAPPA